LEDSLSVETSRTDHASRAVDVNRPVAFIVRVGGRDSDGNRSVDTKNRWAGVA
jgi:hypothetical protein